MKKIIQTLSLLLIMSMLCAAFPIMPAAAAAAAVTYRVIPGGLASGACGDTWADGCDLQYALTTLAVSGDEIWVKMGAYKPTATTDRKISFTLKNGVQVYGGFAGTETTRGGRNWQAYQTILSGDLNGDDGVSFTNNSENSLHVVAGDNLSSGTVLDGFTIRGGNAGHINFSTVQERRGGGLKFAFQCPTLNNLLVTGNNAEDDGGGMYSYNCTSTFSKITFSSNRAERDGGGMYSAYLSSFSLNQATFENNTAVHGGGGFYETGSASTMTDVYFDTNAADFGGGVFFDDTASGGPKLITAVFSENNATSRGGAIYLYSANLTLSNALINGNTATTSGGGLDHYNSTSILTNATFSGNTAPAGMGIVHGFSGSNITIQNSLLYGDNGGEISLADTSTATIQYSLVQGCYPSGIWNPACGVLGGPNVADADPLFVIGYHLGAGSPAHDAGNNAYAGDFTVDLEGYPRINSGVIDLGGYEYQRPAGTLRIVPAGGKTFGACGDTWANGCELHYALETRCIAGDELWVKAGTYLASNEYEPSDSFVLKNGVKMYGGFAGTESSRNQRNWKTNTTLLSGDLNGDDAAGFVNISDNSSHVVYISGTNSIPTLDGFTISGGNAATYGGGIYVVSATPELDNLIITNNKAATGGGGMYNDGQPRMINVTFTNNLAGNGGGLYANKGLMLIMAVFNDNQASLAGGAIYNINNYAMYINALFYDNSASQAGGAIYNHHSNPTLLSLTLANNSAPLGSAVYNINGSYPNIQSSIFWGNLENGQPGAGIRQAASGDVNAPMISFSLADGCNPGGVWNTDCGDNAGSNVADAVPLFVDAGAKNFHLLPVSPAIDSGSDVTYNAGFTLDLDGNPRKFGAHVDIGAYECQTVIHLIFMPAVIRP